MIARLKAGLTVANLTSAAAGVATCGLSMACWVHRRGGFASGNAVLCRLLILSYTVSAILQILDWRSWMNLVSGVWVLLSPWILGFAKG